MRVEEFKILKRQKVSLAISSNFFNLSYAAVQKLLKQKDVKVNGKRISKDIEVFENDVVTFYIKENETAAVDVVYQDENIVVIFKKRRIETVSETGENDLCYFVSKQVGCKCFAVHRLDRNTEGLVVFAKNEESKKCLDLAFKNRTIDKFYLALVYGSFEKQEDILTAYLKKHQDKSYVEISDYLKPGFDKIKTGYKVFKSFEDYSIVEVELFTGKTHQIRAHFAHVNHFVIGDEKYGDSNVNKKFKSKYQNLCAYKLKFKFKDDEYLSYLNNKEIVLEKSKIDFCQNL